MNITKCKFCVDSIRTTCFVLSKSGLFDTPGYEHWGAETKPMFVVQVDAFLRRGVIPIWLSEIFPTLKSFFPICGFGRVPLQGKDRPLSSRGNKKRAAAVFWAMSTVCFVHYNRKWRYEIPIKG